MHRTLFALAFVLCLVQPSFADERQEDMFGSLTCSPTKAEWLGSGDVSNGEPFDGHTGRMACAVNGVTLEVRARPEGLGGLECSAAPHVYVSAWVNGVKAVSYEEAGPYAQCMGGLMLQSVSLDKRGTVKICHQKLEQAEETDNPATCQRISAKKWRREKADPAYVFNAPATPAGLVLTQSNAKFCTALSQEVKPDDWSGVKETGSLSVAIKDIPWQTVANPEPESGFWKLWWDEIPMARFDIDNDGTADEVYRGRVIKRHGGRCCELAWRSGRAKKGPFQAKFGHEIGTDNAWGAYDIEPVRIEGQNYVYMRRIRGFDWDDFSEISEGASGSTELTRAIVELHPDGRSSVACGWAPRPRPEERL